MTYVRTKPLSLPGIDMDKRAFAISRGYMVHPREEHRLVSEAKFWYIVGPRDVVDKQAARKGQERSFDTEAEAWYVAWQRSSAAKRRRE